MSAPVPQGDLRERMLTALRAAKKPVALKALAKLVKAKDENLLRPDLEAAVAAHEIFLWSKPSGPEKFWHLNPSQLAREAILNAASTLALSKAEMNKKVTKGVPGFPSKRVEALADEMLAEKILQTVPALTGTSKLFMKSGCTEAYFNTARLFLTAKVSKAGFDPAGLFRQPSAPAQDAAKRILDAVESLEPVSGVPVSTLRLRNHLHAMTKREFDSAALDLRKDQKVFLSQHSDPHNIPQEDKDLLINGQDGTYYVAIAIR